MDFFQKLVYKSCSSTASLVVFAGSQLTLFLGWQVPPAPFIRQEHDQVLFALDEIRGKMGDLDFGHWKFLGFFWTNIWILWIFCIYQSYKKKVIHFCDDFLWAFDFFLQLWMRPPFTGPLMIECWLDLLVGGKDGAKPY